MSAVGWLIIGGLAVGIGGDVSQVQGSCREGFEAFEEIVRSNLGNGVDHGASLVVALDGEPMVDLWGGTRDYEGSAPWNADTLVRIFSTSKVVVITCVLMLVDRGVLDLDEPIASHWPEFGQHGKETITPRQVLVHRSGVPGYGRSVRFADMGDWAMVIRAVEEAVPWFEPGTVSCYGPNTFGVILGGLLERLTGVAFDEFVRRELTGPLGADFHFGLTDPADIERVAAFWPPPDDAEWETPDATKLLDEIADPESLIDPACMATVVPGLTGISSARGMARVGAMLAAGGELDGRRYLDRAVLEEATREHSYADDRFVGWCRYGLGFGLHSDEFPAPTPTTFHWGGMGGSFITMDMTTGLSSAFAPNTPLALATSDPRQDQLWAALGDVSRALR